MELSHRTPGLPAAACHGSPGHLTIQFPLKEEGKQTPWKERPLPVSLFTTNKAIKEAPEGGEGDRSG